MGDPALYEGHWRSLEQSFLKEVASPEPGPLAVVTAGYPLLERLTALIDLSGIGPLAGVQFFPGIPRLAEKLSPLPVPPPPSPAALTGCALPCFGPDGARAGAAFLAGLLDQGIGPKEFGLVLMSLQEEPGPTALDTLRALEAFEERLSGVCLRRSDTVMEETPEPGFSRVFMYGFYDLNPGQRRFIRTLWKKVPVTWFSPVHPSSPWRDVYSRTGEFLGALYGNRRHRIDSRTPLSPMALLGESLLLGKALEPPPGLEVITCGSGLGFDSGLVRGVEDALALGPGFRVAVCARGEDRDRAVSALKLAGVPVASGASIPWSVTPFGAFLKGVCGLHRWNWHHLDIHRILASRIVFSESPDEYLRAVSETGARFGLRALRSIPLPFAERLAAFGGSLPEGGPAGVYLEALLTLCEDPPGVPLPGALLDRVFNPLHWRCRDEVTLEGFEAMLDAQLRETSAEIFRREPEGVRVLSPEQLRGTLFDGVVVTGLEEDLLPSRHVEDPRFPTDLRRALEMTTGETREREEAFILRQVFEAAREKLTLIVRTRDAEGRPREASPFISRLLPGKEAETPAKTRHLSDSAIDLMTPPASAPFLESSLSAERERLFLNRFGAHDGIIGPGLYRLPDRISASLLESYQACPFKFMVERIWGLSEEPSAPVLSFPAPADHGTLVHRAVGNALLGASVPKAVEKALEGWDPEARLGSRAFARGYTEALTEIVREALKFFDKGGYAPVAVERTVKGVVAGLPAGGRIDLLATGPDGLTAFDLKTGNPGKTVNPLGKPELFQLPFYYSILDRKPAVLGYLHLRIGGEPVPNTVTETEILDALPGFEERVREITEKIRSGHFPPAASQAVCRYCPHERLCRSTPKTRMERKSSGENAAP